MNGLLKLLLILDFILPTFTYYTGISSTITPGFLIALIILCLRYKYASKNRIFLYTATICIALMFFVYSTGRILDIRSFSNAIFKPIIIYLCFAEYKIINWKKISKLIINLYTINCIISILERILRHNFLGDVYIGDGNYEFRSIGFYGHPLQCAIITLIVYSFILYSDIKNKLFYLIIGCITIFCYNGRTAILTLLLITALYFLHIIFSKNQSILNKFIVIALFTIAPTVILFLIMRMGLGGRFLTLDIETDGSIRTRLVLLDLFNLYSISDFLWGFKPKALAHTIEKVSTSENMVIENFWILYMLRFGIIFLSLLTLIFINIFRKISSKFNKYFFLSVLIPIIILCSTNNSIATGAPIFTYLFILFLGFPISNKYIKQRLSQ